MLNQIGPATKKPGTYQRSCDTRVISGRAGGRKFENRIYGNVICVMNMGDGLPGNEGPAMWWFVMW